MRYLFLILFLIPLKDVGQPLQISNAFIFHEGIYTSFGELLRNAPRYLNCDLDIVKPPVGYPKYYYYDSVHVQHTYNQRDAAFLYYKI